MSDKIPNMDYDADEVIENFKSKFKWPTKDTVEVVVAPPKLALKLLLSFLITLVLGSGVYYMLIPALNFKTTDFYIFIAVLIAIFWGSFFLLSGANKKIERREYVKKKSIVPIIIVAVMLVVMVIGYLVGCTLFRAKDYASLMPVNSDSNFSEDFANVNYDEVPQLDSATSAVLADQELGSLDEYKSQYVVSTTSTQINFTGSVKDKRTGEIKKFTDDHPCRVAYLEYVDVFKWFNNTKNGLPAYMLIDLVTQDVTVVDCVDQFGEGIKYSPTELFNEKLVRHLRFQYPTAIMDTPNFEIDNTGHPYWITPVLDKTIGLFGGTDVKGVIITDALNGNSEYYSVDTVKTNPELEWIDVVYSENLIIEQYNYYGKLSGGFWNSIFFQNDVNVTSSGKGMITLGNDVWVYTGVTSSKSDTSNFGFILCNQRTKETKYYKNGGSMEASAMESAEDAVQNYGYRATFPILLDIGGQPTYFMSLYGDGYTIKGYAYVNLSDKTIVGYSLIESKKETALTKARDNYIEALSDKGKIDDEVATEIINDEDSQEGSKPESTNQGDENPAQDSKTSVTGEVTDIKTSVNDGNTVFYLQIKDKYYYIAVNDCMDVLLIEKGDKITVTFDNDSDTFVKAKTVELKQ
ncbi:MAG: hypothetical protein ACI4IG_08435 [Eubacterium sp.]